MDGGQLRNTGISHIFVLSQSSRTMIISASRRTDIPAYYSEWFVNRLREGYFIVSNPNNSADVSRVQATPDVVDCIAFRTKNLIPMFDKIERMADYSYFFQVTMNPYGREMERNVPRLEERVETFKRMTRLIGPERMTWRYDPVIITPKYDFDFHARAFGYLARELDGFAQRCLMGFIELHPFVAKRTDPLGVKGRDTDDILRVGAIFGKIASQYGLNLSTCAERTDLEQFGIAHGACIDRQHVESIVGYRFGKVREKYLRPYCNCMESIDIGHYDTCLNGCEYCYATINQPRLQENPASPSLDPHFDPAKCHNIKTIECRSFRKQQLELL